MKLIKAEFKKSLIEAASYYPDYIVGILTDILLLVIVMNTEGEQEEKLFAYVLWILVNGVLSEASLCISTEKQMGTLQNLMIKPYSIMQIISVKTLVWFLLNSVKACICIGIASLFIKLTFRFEYFYIVILVCFGCMGISYILSALTLIFTKMASFVSIVGYLFLFLSGSILSLPGYLNYTNPLSAGSHFYALLIHQTAGVKDFFMLLILCAVYFFVGKEIFAFVFRRSKQFKWTY